jgi:uncharacterized protein (TIGR02118 family)
VATAPEYEAGLKLIELVPKRADISDDLFHYHWHAIHGPLARGVESVERYVQHHRIYERIDGLPALRYEGVVEAWFADLQSMADSPQAPAYFNHVAPHEPIQVDLRELRNMHARSVVYRQAKEIGPAAASIVMCVARRPDRTHQAFLESWRAHAELALRMPGLERYVQNDISEGGDPDKAGYAAVAFMTFKDVFVLEHAWASEAGQRAIVADLASFALPSACAALVSHERRVIWP